MASIKSFAIALFIFYSTVCFGQLSSLKFEHFNSENGLPQNTIHGIAKDKYGFMWFGTWAGLCRFDGYKFRVYHHDQANKKSINNDRIHNVYKDANQTIWVQTFDTTSLCRYNYLTDDFDNVPINRLPKNLYKLVNRRDHLNRFSYTYKNYRWFIDQDNSRLIQQYLPTGQQGIYAPSLIGKQDLNDSEISDMFIDEKGILWVGTYNNGLNKANLNAKPFNYVYHAPLNNKTIIDNHITSICEDQLGNLWLGTRNTGVMVLRKNGTSQFFKSSNSALANDQIRSMFCDSFGNIWVGSKKGLNKIESKTGKVDNFYAPSIDKIAVYGINEDHAKNVWFATWNGIHKFTSNGHQLVHLKIHNPMLTWRSRAITIDQKGQIWIGTDGNGVTVVKEIGKDSLAEIIHFDHKSKLKNTISDNRIYSIFEDSEKTIWIGTGNGLDRNDPKDRSFHHFQISQNGLSSALIAAITEDDKGSLWVSHKRGISQLDKKTFQIRNYSIQDGLQSNEFYDGSVYKNKLAKILYFGGNNGFNSFQPDSITNEFTLPEVVLTELQILNKTIEVNQESNGRIVLQKPLYLSSEISLTHNDKSFSIEFAALHYSNTAGNKYAYKLEGFDKDWIYTDATRRMVSYSNLEPGNYVFMVKASNSDGIWNPNPKTLKITVLPAFWASNWAYLFYFLVFAGLLYAFYYYAIRYTKLRSKLSYESIIHDREIRMQNSKIEFFTNISHEIKTPLSLILAPIERLMDLSKDNQQVSSQLQTLKDSGDRLLKLTNQLLDIRRIETGNHQLRLEKIDLLVFVGSIMNAFRLIAEERHISFTLNCKREIGQIAFDPDKLEKILFNVLANAFRFTKDRGKIEINLDQYVHESTGYTSIKITDNGLGIPSSDLENIFKPFQQGSWNKSGGTGLGLAYCKALVELHNGTIKAESGKGKDGHQQTTFTVTIPLEQKEEIVTDHNRVQIDIVQQQADQPIELTKTNDEKPAQQSISKTLLLAEDNAELRNYLKDYFSSEYKIIEAVNGKQGVDLAIEHLPDLIVSDLMMPEMDGFELCKIIKENIMTSDIPVLLLTASTPMESQIKGLESGADDYIIKPFNLSLLSLKIKNILANRQLLREKFKKKISVQPSTINPVSQDEKLLKRFLEYLEERISDADLTVDDIAKAVALSRTQLYQKMNEITGMSVAELIKEIRLKRARQLLRNGKFNVNEICYMVGFTDPDYFRKCFKRKYAVSPSQFAKHPDGED